MNDRMELPLDLGHRAAGKDAAEIPKRPLPRDGVDRDDSGERAEGQKDGRARRIPHEKTPSNCLAAAFAPTAADSHGEELIFF